MCADITLTSSSGLPPRRRYTVSALSPSIPEALGRSSVASKLLGLRTLKPWLAAPAQVRHRVGGLAAPVCGAGLPHAVRNPLRSANVRVRRQPTGGAGTHGRRGGGRRRARGCDWVV